MCSIALTSVLVIMLVKLTFSEGCGETFTSSSGFFISPNYPSDYSSSLSCVWYIQPTSGTLTRLVFVDYVTESGYDSVTVYNGTDVHIAYLTGERSGTVVESSTSFKVQFNSDPWTTRRGFRAEWDVAPSATVDAVNGLHAICSISTTFTLVNSTGTSVMVTEIFLTSSLTSCMNVCLLIPSCTHAAYDDSSRCSTYAWNQAKSMTLVNIWMKKIE